ncbi:hypothetical protein SEPCBS119000_003616 [Sporothrix epigloea]|uniref:Uncharacterized protein n=1 Tax=Sporothrix epigloea TaxID=1892477 RepID=A0ABP0DPE9_9PEZI
MYAFAADSAKRMLSSFGLTASEADNSSRNTASGPYQPSICDVIIVKAMLQRHCGLPLELVDAVMDEAAYWAHARAEVNFFKESGSDLVVSSRSYSSRSATAGNRFLLRTPPLGFQRAPVRGGIAAQKTYTTQEPEPVPSGEVAGSGECSANDIRGWLPANQAPQFAHPCRKIVFTMVSRDQGWASSVRERGTYKGSYSWFDVGLERYGWKEKPASAKEDTSPGIQTESGTRTGKEKDSETAPLCPAAPEAAVLYTVRPAVIATPSSPPPILQISRRDQPPDRPPSQWQFDFPLNPGNDRLQSNCVATKNFTKHTVVWSWTDEKPARVEESAEVIPEDTLGEEDNIGFVTAHREPFSQCPLDEIGRGSDTGDGSFVNSLRVGDVVTVWAKARFPGWVNMVRSAQVDVYWAVS